MQKKKVRPERHLAKQPRFFRHNIKHLPNLPNPNCIDSWGEPGSSPIENMSSHVDNTQQAADRPIRKLKS
jgi:hypothetical protein